MIPKGTIWRAKRSTGGIFAFTIVEEASGLPMAEVPYLAGTRMSDRAEVAALVERAPAMRDACLLASQTLRATGSPALLEIAKALEDVAGGPL